MGLVERIVEFTDLPKDVICSDTVVQIVAEEEVCVMNHRGIVSCDQEEIIIYVKKGKCRVNGTNLMIKEINCDSITISGKIRRVEYL